MVRESNAEGNWNKNRAQVSKIIAYRNERSEMRNALILVTEAAIWNTKVMCSQLATG